MNKKNVYFLFGGILIGAILIYFTKDYIDGKIIGKKISFSEPPAKAR